MKIQRVQNDADWKKFHQVLKVIYGKDPNWICPLNIDVRNAFDPNENKYIATGYAAAFIVEDDNGNLVGRFATFVDHKRNEIQNTKLGGIGYFECIENTELAKAMFDYAEEDLKKQGIESVVAPINLGERDRFWGLLEKGYDLPPYYLENYHPRYYKPMYEANGYSKYEQILTLTGVMADIPIRRFRLLSERAQKRYPLRAEILDMKKIDKYANDAAIVYNEAFKHTPFFQPLNGSQVYELFRNIKQIIDPKMIVFAYYEDFPVGFGALVPEINEFFKGFRGKINKIKGLRFLWRFRTAKQKDLKGIAFAVHPQYQSKGVYPIMCDLLYTEHTVKTYRYIVVPTIRG
ncbi:MAG: hypothetical protein AAFO07_19210, partial [Bacteroidota bacterium]